GGGPDRTRPGAGDAARNAPSGSEGPGRERRKPGARAGRAVRQGRERARRGCAGLRPLATRMPARTTQRRALRSGAEEKACRVAGRGTFQSGSAPGSFRLHVTYRATRSSGTSEYIPAGLGSPLWPTRFRNTPSNTAPTSSATRTLAALSNVFTHLQPHETELL